jgi:hypothetical protein
MDPKTIMDQVINLVEQVNKIGDSVEVALKAFRDHLFTDGVSASAGAYSQLQGASQQAVEDAVAACKSSEPQG